MRTSRQHYEEPIKLRKDSDEWLHVKQNTDSPTKLLRCRGNDRRRSMESPARANSVASAGADSRHRVPCNSLSSRSLARTACMSCHRLLAFFSSWSDILAVRRLTPRSRLRKDRELSNDEKQQARLAHTMFLLQKHPTLCSYQRHTATQQPSPVRVIS